MDDRRTKTWLARHGLAGVPPTPLLAARPAARHRVDMARLPAAPPAAEHPAVPAP